MKPETPDTGWMGDRKRGASHGRPAKRPTIDPAQVCERLSLQRAHLNAAGYDRGGAYWGIGAPLFYYANATGTLDGYVRGRDRAAAKKAVLAKYPNVVFRR